MGKLDHIRSKIRRSYIKYIKPNKALRVIGGTLSTAAAIMLAMKGIGKTKVIAHDFIDRKRHPRDMDYKTTEYQKEMRERQQERKKTWDQMQVDLNYPLNKHDNLRGYHNIRHMQYHKTGEGVGII